MSVTDSSSPEAITPTQDSSVKSSGHNGRNTVLLTSRCRRHFLKGKFTFTLLFFKIMSCLFKMACHSPELRKSGTNCALQQNSFGRGVCKLNAGPAVAEAHLLNLQLLLHHTNKHTLSTGLGLRAPSCFTVECGCRFFS